MFLTPEKRIAEFQSTGLWSGITVDAVFRDAVAQGGSRIALIDPPNRPALDGREALKLSWNALDHHADHAAALFLRAGLRKDDRIVVQLPNIAEAVIAFLAAARLGLIISPVVMQYREHELRYILEKVQPKAFLTIANFGGFDHAELARGLREGVPDMKILVLGSEAGDTDFTPDDSAKAGRDFVRDHAAAHPVSAGEVLTICWTSGTESRPKGVPRDHNHWVLNAHVVAEATGMEAGDILLNPFPLVNIGSIGGLVMPWLILQGKLVLHHPFDIAIFMKQIADERVTYTIAPPAVLTALLKQPALLEACDISSLRAVASGSAPLSPWLIETWQQDHGIEITNVFGSNEGSALFSGPVHVPDVSERARFFPRFGAKDIVWPGIAGRSMESRLVDPDSETEIDASGKIGELRLRGANIFGGYWQSPEINAASFDDQGYYRTGDLFEIAGTGELARFYKFVGRLKEIIVRGGVNISPAELDDMIVGHPRIKEAATVGIPDDRLGERIAIAVVPNSGEAVDLADITEWLSGQGAAIFKHPEYVVETDVLPRNAMNKVMRDDLRVTVLAALGR